MITSPVDELSGALRETQELLSGPGGRTLCRRLGVLAAMAGVVGVGIQPPPLGLLHPVWATPETRDNLVEAIAPLWWILVALIVLLLIAAAVSRSFTLAFIAALRGGDPSAGSFRRHLGAGLRHFAWSSAFTLPLYAALFWGEAGVTGDAYRRLMDAPEDQLTAILAGAAVRFLLILVPWALLTLPVMVTLYELTPAAMVARGSGAGAAFRAVLASARKTPASFAGYFALRAGLQIAGGSILLIAFLPCAAIAALVCSPVLGAGWMLMHAAGGPGTPGGAAAISLVAAIALTVLYVLVCTAMAPLSAVLYLFALRMLQRG